MGDTQLIQSFLFETKIIGCNDFFILETSQPLLLYSLVILCQKLEEETYYEKTFKHQYLQSQLADLDQITHTASLGSRKGCILLLGRSVWNSGCHSNIHILMGKK